MRALAFTVSFVLAFLLFAVQPMATKMVLPTLGGTPSVWNTAMLTFQLLLLAGYYYAHVLTTRLNSGWQWRVHGLLIAASFLFLPLSVSLTSSDALVHQPIRHLVGAFLLQVGLPFFVLSATAPLLQSWVARSNHPLSQTPYVLYSASNFGSMLGLLGYVVLVEPGLTLSEQSHAWSALFVAGTVALMLTAKLLKPADGKTEQESEKPGWRSVLLWIWLAFLPSALSLGVTSYITTDIAAVPLLWVLPLALYLLSFVDAFRTRPLLVPFAMRVSPVLGLVALVAYGMQAHSHSEVFIAQLIIFALLAFALHGWMARFKPAPRYLTAFYFCMSIGGALGGALNAIVAPMVFTETLEYPLSLFAASVTAYWLWQRARGAMDASSQLRVLSRVLIAMVANTLVFYVVLGLAMGDFTVGSIAYNSQGFMMAGFFATALVCLTFRRYAAMFFAVLVLGVMLLSLIVGGARSRELLLKERSFFGVWKVYDSSAERARYIMHNTTIHGAQSLDAQGAPKPLTYYAGLRSAFTNLPQLGQHPFALIGLGAGTVKCFARHDQVVDIFEIDPLVVRIAEDAALFRYLSDCAGEHRMHLGDGRVKLAAQPDGRFGAIVMDAFSSDAIPSHLVTREAMQIYFDKLAPGGVLLLHTTNRHINLWPLMAAQAEALGLVAYGKHFAEPEENLLYQSYWVVMARDMRDIVPLVAMEGGWKKLTPLPGARAWTDDYVNILPYLKMLHGED